MEPRLYRSAAEMRDGTPFRVRAIRADDKERLAASFRRLSAETIRYRFFESRTELTDADLRALTELDFRQRFALVAILERNGEERIVGVGRGVVSGGEGPSFTAEVAFAVEDALQGHGIGTALLDHLARLARELGVHRFEAFVLPDNSRMLEVFLHSGYRIHRELDGGVVHVTFGIDAAAGVREAVLPAV